MTEGIVAERADRQALTAFFFWTSWAAATDRPGETDLSYTSNWPHEPLVGNTMTGTAAMWSMVCIILLLAGIAAMLWFHGGQQHEAEAQPPKADPLLNAAATPSMKATRKYFFAVIGLMLLQIGMGAITAHYAVEGQSFFGIPLAQVLPYVVSRTVHTQIGIFWIATAWLATGLYIAPLLSGPRAEAAEARRRRAVLGPDRDRRRLHRHRLARHAAAPRLRLQLLGRQPGPRVHEHGPRLADPAVRRPAVLGRSCSAARCGRR